MSRILLSLLIILCFSFFANAQFNKGDILLGGTLGFHSEKNSAPSQPEIKSNSGIYNIALGKAVNENTVVGVDLLFSPSSSSNYYSGFRRDFLTNNYNIGIFYRCYKSLGKDFFLFGQAGAGYIGSTTSVKDSTGHKLTSGTSNGGYLNFMPGIAYKISKKFFLEISIPAIFNATYVSNKFTNENQITSKSDEFSISTSLNSNPLNALGIGFRLIL